MAVLSTADRQDACADLMREISEAREPFGALTKGDLRAAINALDDWLHTNAATINTAIPQPARGALTASQKARLLARLITKRFVRGA